MKTGLWVGLIVAAWLLSGCTVFSEFGYSTFRFGSGEEGGAAAGSRVREEGNGSEGVAGEGRVRTLNSEWRGD